MMRATVFAVLLIAVASVAAITTPVSDCGNAVVALFKVSYNAEHGRTTFHYSFTGSSIVGSVYLEPSGTFNLHGDDWAAKSAYAPWSANSGFLFQGDAIGDGENFELTLLGNVNYSQTGTNVILVFGDNKYCSVAVGGPVLSGASAQQQCCRPSEAEATAVTCTVDVAEYNLSTCNAANLPSFLADKTFSPVTPFCAGNRDYTIPWSVQDTASAPFILETVCEQVVHVRDTSAPTISYNPPLDTLEVKDACRGHTFPEPSFTVLDDCDSFANATCEKKNVAGRCIPETSDVWTVTATDECGNSVCDTFTVLYRDITKPTVINMPPSDTKECTGGDPSSYTFAQTDVQGADDCKSDTCLVTLSGPATVIHQGSCPNTFTKVITYTVEDCCKNVNKNSSSLHVTDNTAPTLDLLAHDEEFTCNEEPVFADTSNFDVCAKRAFTVDRTNSTQYDDPSSACPEDKLMNVSYTVCDECGNKNSTDYTISFKLKGAPKWATYAENVTIECGENIPVDEPTATYICGAFVNVSLKTVTYPGLNDGCNSTYEIHRIWQACPEDACLFADRTSCIEYLQTITVVDTNATKIDLESLPDANQLSCAADFTAELEHLKGLASDITAQDCLLAGTGKCGCNYTFDITSNNPTGPQDSCNRNTILTFTATDCAGNTDDANVTINVNDQSGPTLTPPTRANQECSDYNANEVLYATVADNCDTIADVADNGTRTKTPLSPACDGNQQVTAYFHAQDNCQNKGSTSVSWELRDTTGPVCEKPTVLPLDCKAVQGATKAQRLAFIKNNIQKSDVVCSDACSGEQPATKLDPEIEDGDCKNNYTVTLFWEVKDDCGNPTKVNTTFEVADNEAPNIKDAASFNDTPILVTDCKNIPPPPEVCAEDNCASVDIIYSQTISEEECALPLQNVWKIITRTWYANDSCGLVSDTIKQILWVKDDTAPTFNPQSYTPDTKSCVGYTPPAGPSATDYCDGSIDPVPSNNESSVPVCKARTIEYKWNATDACGNTNETTQLVTITDQSGPIVTEVKINGNVVPFAGSSLEYRYYCDFPTVDITWSDDCSGIKSEDDAGEVVDVETDESNACNKHITKLFTAKDNCDNGGEFKIKFIYIDEDEPQGSINQDAVVPRDCDDDIVDANVTTLPDSCGDHPSVSGPFSVTVPDPKACSFQYNTTKTWTLTDSCGKTKNLTQLIVVNDQEGPELTFTGFENPAVNFCVPPAIPSSCATDNCGGPSINYTETPHVPNANFPLCPYSYTYNRT